MQSKFRGALLGLSVADAVGTTVEFKPRGAFPPVIDMLGGGPFNLKAGQWTDDTSMALCLATSLVEKQGFDPLDQMQRYVRWMNHGYLSSTGVCFDIGTTTSAALRRFQSTGNPFSGSTDAQAAGNGSIMRLAPVPIFFHSDWADVIHYSGESSRTTHGSAECVDACRLLGSMLFKALDGQSKDEILFGSHLPKSEARLFSAKIQAIANGQYRSKSIQKISGNGYVVNSLEAALWCFYKTESYREAVLMAVNLGDDADTTAAVVGQIAGAYYGEAGIPAAWLQRLTMRDEMRTLATQLVERGA